MRKVNIFASSVIILITMSFDVAIAHRGRTNSQGCHNHRRTNTYHCHGGSSGSGSSGSGSSRGSSGRPLTIANLESCNVSLKLGDTGEAVGQVQKYLAKLNYLPSNSPDGIFGSQTNAAVLKYQKDKNLTIDGVVGCGTFSSLKKDVSNLQLSNLPTCNVKPGSVYDGDTLRVFCNGQELKIRFACIDAPETKQVGGIEARDHLRSLLSNSNNQVKVNAITTDRYDRTVAELFFLRGNDWQLVQEYQARDGMVWGYDRYKSDCPSWEAIATAQQKAQAANRGLWAGNPSPPWEWRSSN